MPTNVIETASKGDVISIPVGTDKRKASSLAAAFQAIGNRLAWLENWTDEFFSSVLFENDAEWTIADDKYLKILGNTVSGDGTGQLDLADVYTLFGGFVRGHLFEGNATGRANKKPLALAPAGGTTDINPMLYDVFQVTGTAACTVQIQAAIPYVDGEHFRVCNYAATSGYTVTVKDPAGTTLFVVPVATGTRTSWADFVLRGSTWQECGSNTP